MNPIRSTSEPLPWREDDPDFPVSWNASYTVIGSRPAGVPAPAGAVVLFQAGLPDWNVPVEELFLRGFVDVVLVDSSERPRDAEALCRAWPGLRVLRCDAGLGIGSRINLALRESGAARVLVMRSAHQLLPFVEDNLQRLAREPVLLSVPLFRNASGEVLPSLHRPVLDKGQFRVSSALSSRNREATLFPHDFAGLYDRSRFLAMGGYDEWCRSAWWQLLEFGCRSWLWGEQIMGDKSLRLQLREAARIDDTTPDEDYLRFLARIVLPRYAGDHADLGFGAWFRWYGAAGGSFWRRRAQYRQLRTWVGVHASRYRQDMACLIDMWNQEESR